MVENNKPSNLLFSEHTGLLLVDVQTKLFPYIADREELCDSICRTLRIAGNLHLPIWVCEQYTKGLGSTITEVQLVLTELEAFSPIEKTSFSCFDEPSFLNTFQSSHIDTLAIIGIEAHICVLQTALHALDRNLRTFVISEAVGSRKISHKEEALKRIRKAGGITGSLEMFAFEMMKTAKHPAFRAVQRIIA